VLDESVNFGQVKYMCEAQSIYWLENTGDAIAYYRLYSSRAPARPLSATPRYVNCMVYTINLQHCFNSMVYFIVCTSQCSQSYQRDSAVILKVAVLDSSDAVQ
jgi:hypothetical protein